MPSARSASEGTTPGPEGPVAADPVRLGTAAGRWVVLATVLASGMAMLDATAVNVALPAIGRSLGSELAGLQWTLSNYTLTLASLILLGGALGDRYGRRRSFLVGVVWFAVASLGCGLTQSTGQLVAARALQGIGGALLTPGSLAIIQTSFWLSVRLRVFGAWSALGGGAGLSGPFLGGFLVDAASWRWVFLVNAPLAVVVVLVTVRHVPESRAAGRTGRFDVLGAVWGAVALAGATYALLSAGDGPGRPQVWGSAAVGVLAGVAFVVREHRAPEPMLPPQVFADRGSTGRRCRRPVPLPGGPGLFLLGRRAARGTDHRGRHVAGGRAADRDGAGRRPRAPGRRGQRRQQRGGPGGEPARGGGAAGRGRTLRRRLRRPGRLQRRVQQ